MSTHTLPRRYRAPSDRVPVVVPVDRARQIVHAYAVGQAELVPHMPRTEALRGFYAWLLQHEVKP